MSLPWRGIVASIVGSTAVGFVWYSSPVFGKKWLCYTYPGKTIDDMRKKGLPVCGFVPTMTANACTMLLVWHLTTHHMGLTTVQDAAQAGFGLSVISCLLQVPHYAYAGRPWGLYLINKGYDITFLVLGTTLMFWLK